MLSTVFITAKTTLAFPSARLPRSSRNWSLLSSGASYAPSTVSMIYPSVDVLLTVGLAPSECAARALNPADVHIGDDVNKSPAVVATALAPPLPVDTQATCLPAGPTLPAVLDDDPTLDPLNENFDSLNADIDWETMEFFDAETLKELNNDGSTGSQPGLSLTAELGAPLPDHIVQALGQEIMGTLGRTGALSADVSLFNPLANAITAPDLPPTHELPAARTPTTDIATSSADAGIPPSTATSPVTGMIPQYVTTATSPADAGIPPSTTDTATSPVIPQSVTTATSPADASTTDTATSPADAGIPPSATTDAVTSLATADVPASITTGAISKSKDGSQRGPNKRSRDPIDLELIVPGKRARKAKERVDADAPVKQARKKKGMTTTKASKPRGKQNRPPGC